MSDEVFKFIVKTVPPMVVTYVLVKYVLKNIDSIQSQISKNVALNKLKQLGLKTNLDKYELRIAENLLIPEEIKQSWKDVAGHNDIKEEIFKTVIFPMKKSDLFQNSDLMKPPSGILLHGPPGCGKTLIAKATAKEAGVRFINLDISCITDKGYGESSKLASALFSFAEKVQPCIIFIDEIDSLLRSRSTSDHEATAQMKALFLSHWDGLATNQKCNVIIMGATNRPNDIDIAIRRRMPKVFSITLPNEDQRLGILKLVLNNENHSLTEKQFISLSKLTDSLSANDLEEMCREVASQSLENIEECDPSEVTMKKFTFMDFLVVLNKMKDSKDEIS